MPPAAVAPQPGPMTEPGASRPSQPLLLSADPLLVDEVLRLAAATGVEFAVLPHATASSWSSAPLVVVGADVLETVCHGAPARRQGVMVVRRRDRAEDLDIPSSTWRAAVRIGAEHVIDLPDGERWMIDRLAEVSDESATGGPVIACVSGIGGAGASTLACMLARESGGLLVDIDTYGAAIPVGGGIRWPDLAATSGRVPAASLRGALPTIQGAHVLTGTADSRFAVPVDALISVLDAGARGFPCTVIDTPRSDAEATRTAWSRSDVTIIVLGPHPASAVRLATVMEGIQEVCTRVAIVARTRHRDPGLWCRAAAEEWSVPLLGVMRHERSLASGDHVFHLPRRTGRPYARGILDALAGPARPGFVAAA